MLSKEKLADLEHSGYNAAEIEAVDRWVRWCDKKIANDPASQQTMIDSLRNGEWTYPLSFGVDSWRSFFSLSHRVIQAGADSPVVTSLWMAETLERL